MTRLSRATLGIYSETHRADAVSAVVGLEPTSLHEKDERRMGKDGREYSPYPSSAWLLDAQVDVAEPGIDPSFVAVFELLDLIESRGDALARLRPQYSTVIWWSGEVTVQGNFVIPARELARLGALGCDLLGSLSPENE